MDSGERGMNPVAMTIMDPRKEYWPSQGLSQRPVLKSAMLLSELWASACKELNLRLYGKGRNCHVKSISHGENLTEKETLCAASL